MSTMQALTCKNCQKDWTRTPTPGRPPLYCTDCRKLGQALGADVKTAGVTLKKRSIPGRHYNFTLLMQTVEARVHALLVGPAGSGKSTAGRQVAQALGLEFYTESCSPQMTKYDLFGFMNAAGGYTAGIFRDAFEFGGVILLDEVDASNPAVLVALNLLASVEIGETVTFPDGKRIARHENFILIAGANTWGDGASDAYMREQLDAASTDRFAGIEWGYDLDLERSIVGEDAQVWVEYVQMVRKAAEENGIAAVITPRASINGARLLRAGMARKDVEALTIWKGMGEDATRALRKAVKEAQKAAAAAKKPAEERPKPSPLTDYSKALPGLITSLN